MDHSVGRHCRATATSFVVAAAAFAAAADPAAGDPAALPRLSIRRTLVPLPELLDAVASGCGLAWRAEGAEIVFRPK